MSPEQNDTTTCEPIRRIPLEQKREVLGLVQLHPCRGDDAPSTWTIRESLRIGRGEANEIRIDDHTVSRQHAQISVQGGQFLVTDSVSRFGSFADGKPIGAGGVEVTPGAVLRFGRAILLAVQDPDRYAAAPRRLSADYIGLTHDVLAGPNTWAAWQTAITAAPLTHPVLVMGESGTGKEIVARLVHLSQSRRPRLIALNLAAIPKGLFETELFGHADSAPADATQNRQGAFREACGGTLFLDEVSALRPELQVKLLRALENKTVRPLGADSDVDVDVRVVAATNRDLDAAVDTGKFRPDLYYGLSGVVIRLKPLRERRDEILALAHEFLVSESQDVVISALAAEQLLLRRWRGNVRELNHVLVRAQLAQIASGSNVLQPEHLPADSMSSTSSEPAPELPLNIQRLRQAMERSGGNASRAASMLGVSRATLYNFCTRHQIALADFRV